MFTGPGGKPPNELELAFGRTSTTLTTLTITSSSSFPRHHHHPRLLDRGETGSGHHQRPSAAEEALQRLHPGDRRVGGVEVGIGQRQIGAIYGQQQAADDVGGVGGGGGATHQLATARQGPLYEAGKFIEEDGHRGADVQISAGQVETAAPRLRAHLRADVVQFDVGGNGNGQNKAPKAERETSQQQQQPKQP
ncbi:hypothetical protein TYRP_022425 [Tyrophagus putrescentiae]|nr:hypothetical protein TYRP_022425 [Tyrophagus putrescentiae]